MKQILRASIFFVAVFLALAPAISFADSTYPYSTGTLVSEGKTIYFVYGNTKVPFTNYAAFRDLGYSLSNVVKGDLSNYDLSTNYMIQSAQVRHPWGTWLNYKGTIYYMTSDGMVGVPDLSTFNDNGGNLKTVVKANKYDIAILNSKRGISHLSHNDERIIRPQMTGTPPSSNPGSNPSSTTPPSNPGTPPTSTPPTTTPPTTTPPTTQPPTTDDGTFTLGVTKFPDATVGVPYNGSVPYSYKGSGDLSGTYTPLPSGLKSLTILISESKNSGNILVSGTPTQAGNFTISFTITDSKGLSVKKDVPITVNPGSPPTTPPAGTAN